MSGHSKWHTIRRSKGVVDQRRGQLFTKLSRDITLAVREGGGGEPDMNFRLRLMVDKAKANNMPNDSIQRAIERGLGKGNEAALEEVFYEGYGPGGVAILVATATDNRNRTNSDVRLAINKSGGTPAEPGSVSWMFELKGLITADLSGTKLDPDDVQLQAIDAGADDVEGEGNELEIYCEWTQLNVVRLALMEQQIPITGAEKTMRPKTLVQPEEKEALAALRLIEKLEDLDDVQKVFSNLEITDEVAAKF